MKTAKVVLFYGSILEPGAIHRHRDGDPKEGPAWMARSGDAVEGIVVFPIGDTDAPMPARSHAVAIDISIIHGEDWSEVWIGTFPAPSKRLLTLMAFLDQHFSAMCAAGATRKMGWCVAPVLA